MIQFVNNILMTFKTKALFKKLAKTRRLKILRCTQITSQIQIQIKPTDNQNLKIFQKISHNYKKLFQISKDFNKVTLITNYNQLPYLKLTLKNLK